MARPKKSIKTIVFIGFMGTGKSLAAQLLARELDWRDLDSDVIIERREGKNIPRLFKDKGESYFRTVESKVLKDLLQKPQAVVSLGGGVVCRKVNRLLIRKRAFVIWLKSRPTVIHKRTKKSKSRPLLNVDNREKTISSLLKERELFYKRCAHVVINNNSGTLLPKLKRIPQIKDLIKVQKAKLS